MLNGDMGTSSFLDDSISPADADTTRLDSSFDCFKMGSVVLWYAALADELWFCEATKSWRREATQETIIATELRSVWRW
jgi:hypothetical protein